MLGTSSGFLFAPFPVWGQGRPSCVGTVSAPKQEVWLVPHPEMP